MTPAAAKPGPPSEAMRSVMSAAGTHAHLGPVSAMEKHRAAAARFDRFRDCVRCRDAVDAIRALEARVKEADRILAKRFPGLQALMARAEKAEAERDAALERAKVLAKVLQFVLDNVAVLTVGGK